MSENNRFIRISLSLMLVLMLCVTSSASIFATEIISNNEGQESSQNFLFKFNNKPSDSEIKIICSADASTIRILAENTGEKTVDNYSVKVTIDRKSKYYGEPVQKSCKIENIKPGETRDISICANMLVCHEDITVTHTSMTKKRTKSVILAQGYRKISDRLSSRWDKGTFGNKRSSINYHFYKHHDEVNSENIIDYAQKAYDYRLAVLNDRCQCDTQNDFTQIHTCLSIPDCEEHYCLNYDATEEKIGKRKAAFCFKKSIDPRQFIYLTRNGYSLSDNCYILTYGG